MWTPTAKESMIFWSVKVIEDRSTVGSADWVFDTVLTSHLIGDSPEQGFDMWRLKTMDLVYPKIKKEDNGFEQWLKKN